MLLDERRESRVSGFGAYGLVECWNSYTRIMAYFQKIGLNAIAAAATVIKVSVLL